MLQLRVPGAHYDQLITRLTALGDVVQKTEQASDVTAQVVDVESRIETQRKSLQQVRALLTRAGTLSQVLPSTRSTWLSVPALVSSARTCWRLLRCVRCDPTSTTCAVT